jgi:multidrug efflux pump subunit AcrA (membrane-fusion protein)
MGLLATMAAAQEPPPALVDLAQAEIVEAAVTRKFIGTIRPKRISVVGSETGGRIVNYPLREGMRVEKGAVLAIHDAKAIELEIAAKRAELRLSREMLQELLNGSRPEEVTQAQSRVKRGEAEVDLRKWRHDNAVRLFENETISEDEVKETRFALRDAEARLVESLAALKLAEEGPRKERIEQARAQVAFREAEVGLLEDNLERHTVRAPFAGYVVHTATELGEQLATGDPLLTLAELDEVEAVIPVPNDAADRLRPGAVATIEIPSLPLAHRRFTGKIVAIVPLADERGRTLPVKILIENPIDDGIPRLKAGSLAVAVLAVGDKAPTLMVPKDAIVLGGPAPMVYVVGEGNAVIPVPVEIGAGFGERVAVVGNIPDGASVVVRGNERLRPGQKVQARK